MITFKGYKDAWMNFFNNWISYISVMCVDLISLFMLTISYELFVALLESPLNEFLLRLANPQASAIPALLKLLLVYIITSLLFYVVFTFVQPFSFRRVLRFSKSGNSSKFSWRDIWFINMKWLGVFLAITIVRDVISVANLVLGVEIMSQNAINLIYAISLGLFFYFMMVGYITGNHGSSKIKDVIKRGLCVKGFEALGLIVLTIFVVDKIIAYIGNTSMLVNFVAGVIFFLPTIVWIRLYLVEVFKSIR